MNRRIAVLSLAGLTAVLSTAPPSTLAAREGEGEILYWVAPMDPNFRRDQPGKSPMGMDLVPVYADEAAAGSDVVSIDPAVVQNMGVRTAEVERGTLWRLIETVGYVAFDERKLSHVHLRTSGWIEKLNVKSDGESVEKNDVLFELYSRELVNAQEEYIQALRGSNDYLKRASRERLDALGMSREQIREVANSRQSTQRVRVLASQDGIVHDLNAREGMYVEPKMEVMTLADLSSIWLLVDVFERQAEWVEVGQPAEVRLAYLPGRVWEGEVEFVYPTIDPKTRTLRVRLRFDNPDEELKPDMYADVRIYAGPKHDVLSIPREALIRTGHSERAIVALGNGRFAAREVVAGMESGDWVEIVSGLAAGEQVVVSGQFLIDSEASLRASFLRMGADQVTPEPAAAGEPVKGTGTVETVSAEQGKLHIDHAPIEALGWPAMAMDFGLTDAVDLQDIEAGARVEFTLLKGADGVYRIDSIRMLP
jgi:Cu(I)/Ag(I) efflux system membrane fusion protein